MKKYPIGLLSDSTYRCSGYISSGKLLALGLCTALASFSLPSARAASATWTGGADGLQTSLNVGTNWSTGSAAFVDGDTATFDNTTALGTTLTWSATLGPGSSSNGGLSLSYTGSGNLTLNNIGGDPFIGVGNITVAAGAGVFTFGDGGTVTTMVFRGSANASTFTNNSSNTAVFASDAAWRAGAGAAKTVTFAGTGNWLLQSAFRIDPSQGQSGLTLIKTGAGTLELSGANNFGTSPGGITLSLGALSVTGAGSLGQGGSYAQPITLTAGTFTYGSTAAQTLSGVISGAGAFNQTAGTLTLTGANTFTGPVTVTGGTLAVSGAGTLNTAGSVIVNGTGAVLANNGSQAFSPSVSLRSGTLAGTGVIQSVTVPNNASNTVALGKAGAETLTLDSLAFQGATNLTVTKVAASPATASVTVTGALTTTPASGKVKLNASLPFWTSAQFYNFVHAGSFSGSASDFQVGSVTGLTSRQSAVVAVQGTDIGLMINGDTPRWTGAGNSVWDTTSTGNWSLIVGGGATTFLNGDVVQFDDTATSPAVGIAAGGVQPSSTQFANETLSYTLAGPGGITAGSLIKNGAASLTVSAVNSYTGGTIINAGSVVLSGSGTLGATSSAITVNGGILDLGAVSRTVGAVSVAGDGSIVNGQLAASTLTGTGTSGNSTVSAVVGGSGTVVMNGTGGTLTLSAVNTYTGGTTVSAGTLALSGAGTLGGSSANVTIAGGILDLGTTTQTLGTVTLSGPGTIQNGTLDNTDVVGTLTSGTAVVDVPLTGDSTVTANGVGGTLALSGANTYTGATTVTAGTLQLGNGEDTGSISLASPVTVASGATFAINRVVATVQGTDFGTISGAGGFTQRGASTTTLNVANTYTGPTNLLVGTLRVAANGAVGTGTVNINGFGNRLQLSGGITLANPVNTGGGATVENVSGNNTISGAFEFANVGNVVTNVSSTADTLTLGGNLTISTLLNWTTANRVFNFAGAGNTVVNGAIHNSSGTVATIGVTKNGTGTLTLNGTSDYTGTTFAYGGVLRLDGALAVNATTSTASEVTVELDGTLAGTGTIAGNTGVYGTLRPGAGGAQPGGRLRFGGSLSLDSFSTTQFDIVGALYTGVGSTLNSGVNYGGWLKLNFASGIYNGNYTLFELTGAPNGSFAQVTLTTTGETDTPLVQAGSVWSVTSGSITYSFDQATGVLTVTGATNAVTPGSTTLSASAGNATANLSWTAASGADTYIVKRAAASGGPYTVVANGVGGLAYADTGLTNDTTYYYVVQPKDSASGLTGPVSNEVSVTPVAGPAHTALQTWRFEQFGVYDDDGTVLAGDAEDYDHDGLSNLMEYALGTDAKSAGLSPLVLARSGNFLTLTYPRRSPADASVVYVVQASNDLASFSAGAGSTVTTGSISTYTDTVDLSGAGVRRFLRLSVSYTP